MNIWDEAIEAAASLFEQDAADLLEEDNEFHWVAKRDAKRIRALPRPPEADRHAAIVEEVLVWLKARREIVRVPVGSIAFSDAHRAMHAAENALRDLASAELAARAEGGEA
jgi:hypothetical protein